MASISVQDAASQLATLVLDVNDDLLAEVFTELSPGEPRSETPPAEDLAARVRDDLVPEEVVSVWNVLRPSDRNVWFNEADDQIYYEPSASTRPESPEVTSAAVID